MLSWIGFALTIISVYLNAKKIIWNWLVGMASNIVWMIYAYSEKQWALFNCNVILFVMELYGFHKWRKKKVEHVEPVNSPFRNSSYDG